MPSNYDNLYQALSNPAKWNCHGIVKSNDGVKILAKLVCDLLYNCVEIKENTNCEIAEVGTSVLVQPKGVHIYYKKSDKLNRIILAMNT